MKLLLAKMTPSGELNTEKQGTRTPRTESEGKALTKSKKAVGEVQSAGGVAVTSRGARTRARMRAA